MLRESGKFLQWFRRQCLPISSTDEFLVYNHNWSATCNAILVVIKFREQGRSASGSVASYSLPHDVWDSLPG